jgi:hypothetical protein
MKFIVIAFIASFQIFGSFAIPDTVYSNAYASSDHLAVDTNASGPDSYSSATVCNGNGCKSFSSGGLFKITSIDGDYKSEGYPDFSLLDIKYDGLPFDFVGVLNSDKVSGKCCVRSKKNQSDKCGKEGGCCAPCTVQKQ